MFGGFSVSRQALSRRRKDAEVSVIKQIAVNAATENMVVARDVIDENGRVLITAETTLRAETLRQLVNHEVTTVWVHVTEEESAPSNREILAVQDLVSAATRLKMIYSVQNAFYNRDGIAVHLNHLQETIDSIIEEMASREDLFIYLNDIRLKSDYLFLHSVDVSLFAVALGLSMGLPNDDVRCLGMGGLLHDFGKTRIPKHILDKEAPLTIEEFRRVKEHALIGYNILKLESSVDYRIMLMALQHHERCDGRGYPWGISESEIHPLAKIVAVADVYDALTTDRVYRNRIAPYEAIRMMDDDNQYDRGVIQAFRRITVPYHIGTGVRLDNGLAGAVVRINTLDTARPVIWTPQGMLNLIEEEEISIIGVL